MVNFVFITYRYGSAVFGLDPFLLEFIRVLLQALERLVQFDGGVHYYLEHVFIDEGLKFFYFLNVYVGLFDNVFQLIEVKGLVAQNGLFLVFQYLVDLVVDIY